MREVPEDLQRLQALLDRTSKAPERHPERLTR
jgi:hypothetical protein